MKLPRKKLSELLYIFFENYLIFVVILFFFIAYIAKSLVLHWTFMSHSWDLGIFAQQTWLYSHTTSLYNTVRGTNLLSDHFGLILYLFAPFYRLFPRAETILVIQAVLVCLGSLPIYLMAKKYLRSGLAGCALVFAFLSSSGIRGAIDFDFHLATVAIFFVSFFVYFWLNGRRAWGVIFAIIAALCKEDVSLYIGFLAIWFICIDRGNKRKQWQNVFLLFGSGVMFAAIMKIMAIIPSSNANFNYFSFNYLGNSYGDVIKNSILHPFQAMRLVWEDFVGNDIKLNTFGVYFSSFWFLPFLAPDIMLASIPFILTKFVSDRSSQWGLNGQYAVTGMFLLTLATLFVVWRTSKRLNDFWGKNFIYAWSFCFIAFTAYYNFSGKNQEFWNMFNKKEWRTVDDYAPLRKLIEIVPPNTSVASQDTILPHLANRREAYLFNCRLCNIPKDKKFDYLLFSDQYGFEFTEEGKSNSLPVINELLASGTAEGIGRYELVEQISIADREYYLFKSVDK